MWQASNQHDISICIVPITRDWKSGLKLNFLTKQSSWNLNLCWHQLLIPHDVHIYCNLNKIVSANNIGSVKFQGWGSRDRPYCATIAVCYFPRLPTVASTHILYVTYIDCHNLCHTNKVHWHLTFPAVFLFSRTSPCCCHLNLVDPQKDMNKK